MELFERLAEEQDRLARGVSLLNQVDVAALRLVAGVDTAYWTGSDGVEQAVCCVVVVDCATREVVGSAQAQGSPTVPYRPGFLGFRELPLVEAAVSRLDAAPDLFMFDGNGYLHPRRMGIATQASFALGRPTLGVAKTYHRVGGVDYQVPDDRVGAWTAIVADGSGASGSSDGRSRTRAGGPAEGRTDDDPDVPARSAAAWPGGEAPEVLGAAVRTRQGVKPVFVSCGNWIDLDTAVAVALSLVEPSSRLPVPVRQADLATHRARRQARAAA